MRVADMDIELARIDAELALTSDDSDLIAARETSYEDAFMLRESTVAMFNDIFDAEGDAAQSDRAHSSA